MYKDMFLHSPLLALPLFGLVLFFSVFAIVVTRTMSRRAREYDAAALLPLAEEDADE